jgi:hypothetical protein
MIKKRIVILANSIKHDPARCIAGVEIMGERDDEILFGDWIRPVSRLGEGELYPAHTILQGGEQPGVLDVVEIECERRCGDPAQPENWLISERAAWVKLATLEQSILTDLLEAPENLWLQPGMRSDRVTPEYLARIPPQQSLYLIYLRDALLLHSGHKFRLQFKYHGAWYDLAITDPTLAERYGKMASPEIPDCAACISLAPVFHDYHYKLVAALFW